jgi:hypothetical protein
MLSIWISCDKSLKNLRFDEDLSSFEIKNEIKKVFNINPNKLLKLRKFNKSLVPIDRRLAANNKNQPYNLEIVDSCEHSHQCQHKNEVR